jgi:hypothetical protein
VGTILGHKSPSQLFFIKHIIVLLFSEAPRTTVIDTAVIKAPAGQGCPRCGGVVYAAEQVLAKGRVSTYTHITLTNLLYDISSSIKCKCFCTYHHDL